jgi:two-component system, NtrC family, sensor histidine kinase GlrK
MLVGLALMAVPLLVAILTAVLQIRELGDSGQKIVIQGVTTARASQALFGQIASLERTARLYGVLNDPKLIDVYRAQDERLKTTREQLHGQAGAEARQTLEELGTLQSSIAAIVMTTPAASGPASRSSPRWWNAWRSRATRRSTPRSPNSRNARCRRASACCGRPPCSCRWR